MCHKTILGTLDAPDANVHFMHRSQNVASGVEYDRLLNVARVKLSSFVFRFHFIPALFQSFPSRPPTKEPVTPH